MATSSVERYDRYGNMATPPTRAQELLEEEKDDKYSLYNMTSQYLKQLPASEEKQQIRSLIQLAEKVKDDKRVEDQIPTLEIIQRAIEMKQLLKKDDIKYVMPYQEAYFYHVNQKTYTYFDNSKLDYVDSRRVIALPANDVMYYPMEVTSQNGLYNIESIRLPNPESKVMGGKAAPRGYICVWGCIGYYEHPEFEPMVKQLEARCLMLGPGKMALSRVEHKMTWAKDNTSANFNDQVIQMLKNYKGLTFDPLSDSGYMPYVPQKGVYCEWEIKNKPSYGNDNIANAAVYCKGTSKGVLKSVVGANGEPILCWCDKLNVISAHKVKSSSHDDRPLGSVRKIELVFRQYIVERQTEESWPDIWKTLACQAVTSDRVYDGKTYLGPNFNPRAEAVEIITPAELSADNTLIAGHGDVFHEYAHQDMAQHAADVHERYPLEIMDDPEAEAVVEPPPFPPHKSAVFEAPPGKTFGEYLSEHDIEKRDTIFGDDHEWLNSNLSGDANVSHILHELQQLIKIQLIHASRSEEMYSKFEISNHKAAGSLGLEYQPVFNSRFATFAQTGMWRVSSLLSYAKNALSGTFFETLLNEDSLKELELGTEKLSAFKERGDYWLFMYGSVQNGDTFKIIKQSLGHFIKYFSYKLAESDILIPNYDHFSEKKPEFPYYCDGVTHTVPIPYTKKDLVEFGVNPTKEERILAFEAFLTWMCQVALHLEYMNHDSHDIEGIQGATAAVNDFMNSPAIRAITDCRATLKMFMLYFYRLADSPLCCQYGEVQGLDMTPGQGWVPHHNEFQWRTIRDIFNGKLVIKHSRTGPINDFWKIRSDEWYQNHSHDHETQYYDSWWVLTPTYKELLERTDEGRQLNAINEIFRGDKVSHKFAEAQTKYEYVGGASDKVYVLGDNENPREVFGILENGPAREYPIEIIEAIAELNWKGLWVGRAPGTVSDVLVQVNRFTADMLNKLGMWTYCGNYMGLTPHHDSTNTYEFIGHNWKFEDDETTEHPYEVPTRNLGTTAFNCSDYLMGSGSGSAAIRGSDMYFINKYIPAAAQQKTTAYLSAKSSKEQANFRQIFKEPHNKGEYIALNAMGVYRPFGDPRDFLPALSVAPGLNSHWEHH